MNEAREKCSLAVIKNGSGVANYVFRWWETPDNDPKAKPQRRKRTIGSVDEFSLKQANEVVEPWRTAINAGRCGGHNIRTMSQLIAHFRLIEMDNQSEDARAWSTCNRYGNLLTGWIEPRWGEVELSAIVAGEVENWLRGLKKRPQKQESAQPAAQETKPLAPGSKRKIRDLMSVLFNHAIRWQIFPSNPISGPTRKSGVRQSGKRQTVPDILEIEEMQLILANLGYRERAMISTDMITGIRRSELAGLQWGDIDFENLVINIQRSVVDQRTGKCKTEASQKPIPIDEYTAEDLLAWYQLTPYRGPDDWVFATDSNRAGEKRGKQPVWLSKVMQYHIQPLIKQLGITKKVAWHTFRRTFTTLLTANNENVKVVQELLRHASSKVTLDIYAQAQMQDKRRAQLRIVKELRKPQAVAFVDGNLKTA